MTDLSIVVVATTSAAAFVAGTRGFRLSARRLGAAASSTLECIGTVVVFLVMNAFLAGFYVLMLRLVTGRFASLYAAAGITWTVLGLVQGLLFHAWRTGQRP